MKKKLRFLIIEEKAGVNHLDLVRAIQDLGHESHHCKLSDVVMRSNEHGLSAFFGGTDFTDFDIVLPRTVSSNLRLGRLLLRLKSPHQFILDHCISDRDTFGKISQAHTLLDAGVLHPKVYFTNNQEDFAKDIEHALEFPCIAKPIVGSQGRGITLVQNSQEALHLIESAGEDYLFQEYLPIESDYRVFMIGNEVFGAMRRFVAPNDIRSNVSIGAKTEACIPTPTMKEVALRAATAFKYDVAGVDIAIVGEKHYVLEVNRSPQWQGIKNTLGIDPALAIVKYCLEKHRQLQAL